MPANIERITRDSNGITTVTLSRSRTDRLAPPRRAGRAWTEGSSEEVKAGTVVVPEKHHGLSDDARSFDRAPEAAVAGNRPVVPHYVKLSGRDVKRCPACGRGYGGPERLAGRKVRLAEPPAVHVDVAAGRVDGLAGQGDHPFHQVGVWPGAVVARRVGEHDDVALVHVMPVEERLPDEDPVVDVQG